MFIQIKSPDWEKNASFHLVRFYTFSSEERRRRNVCVMIGRGFVLNRRSAISDALNRISRLTQNGFSARLCRLRHSPHRPENKKEGNHMLVYLLFKYWRNFLLFSFIFFLLSVDRRRKKKCPPSRHRHKRGRKKRRDGTDVWQQLMALLCWL